MRSISAAALVVLLLLATAGTTSARTGHPSLSERELAKRERVHRIYPYPVESVQWLGPKTARSVMSCLNPAGRLRSTARASALVFPDGAVASSASADVDKRSSSCDLAIARVTTRISTTELRYAKAYGAWECSSPARVGEEAKTETARESRFCEQGWSWKASLVASLLRVKSWIISTETLSTTVPTISSCDLLNRTTCGITLRVAIWMDSYPPRTRPGTRVESRRIRAERTNRKRARREYRRKLRYIAPYRSWFLGPVGACESGTTTNLEHGLRATSPSGQYLGRYQFGRPDWGRAGGYGDPRDADWLEQGYRAVRWLNINGRQSWPNC